MRIEREEYKLTKRERGMEKDEKGMIKSVKKELEKFYAMLIKKEIFNVPIKSGNQTINLDQCIMVLIRYVDALIRNKISIRQEMQVLNNVKTYWQVAKHGIGMITNQIMLSNDKKTRKTMKNLMNLTNKTGNLFSGIAKELMQEEKITKTKLQLVKEQYNLIMQEEGGVKAQADTKHLNSVTQGAFK